MAMSVVISRIVPPDVGVPTNPANGATNGAVTAVDEIGEAAVRVGRDELQHEAQPQPDLQDSQDGHEDLVHPVRSLPPLGRDIACHLLGGREAGLLRGDRFLAAIHRDVIDLSIV